MVGLVDELVVDNDPEYQWMDNFRQARTSNESRQSLLYKLDATVRRQLGKKVCSPVPQARCVCGPVLAAGNEAPTGAYSSFAATPGGNRRAVRWW